MPTASSLVITRRTLKVADHVYPLANICHFGPGSRITKLLPWRYLVAGALVGLFLTSFDGTRILGTIIALAALAAFIYDLIRGKKFGLMVMLNSGRELFFETTDTRGVAAVASHVYAMLERVDAEDSPKQVIIHENKVTIKDTTVTGNLNTGTVEGGMNTDFLGDPA